MEPISSSEEGLEELEEPIAGKARIVETIVSKSVSTSLSSLAGGLAGFRSLSHSTMRLGWEVFCSGAASVSPSDDCMAADFGACEFTEASFVAVMCSTKRE